MQKKIIFIGISVFTILLGIFFLTLISAGYFDTVTTLSPTFYYAMNDTAGQILDSVGSGLYNVSAPAGVTRGEIGWSDKAYSFNSAVATSYYGTNFVHSPSKNLTITYIINPSSLPNNTGSNTHIITSYDCASPAQGGFSIVFQKTSDTLIELSASYSANNCITSTYTTATIDNAQIDFTKWHLITSTFNTNNGRWHIYVDKVDYGNPISVRTDYTFPASATAIVGSMQHAGQYQLYGFNGIIDELAVYNNINLSSQNVTSLYNSYNLDSQYKNILVNYSYPSNNFNQTSLMLNISCNFTSSEQNISSIKLNVYNSSNFLNFTDTLTLGAGTISKNQTWTNLNFTRFDNYIWSCYGFGNQGANSSTINRTFTISNNSLNIIQLTTSPSTANFGENVQLMANLSYGFGTNYQCNFSLASPNGTMIFSNLNGSNSNEISTSRSQLIDSIGIYKSNVTCYNNFGTSASLSNNFTTAYNINYNPAYYVFSAIQNKSELNQFNVTVYDDINSTIIYNLTTDISNRTNFTIRLSTYSITLNASDNSSNPLKFTFYVNASSQVANGTYAGNITMRNTTLGLEYLVNFVYGISPPGARFYVYDSTNTQICSTLPLSTCSNINSVAQGSTISSTYTIRNTGFFDATNCHPEFNSTGATNKLSGNSWVTFSNNSFSLAQGNNKSITTSFAPTSGITTGNYVGYFFVQCDNSDILGHGVSSIPDMSPFNSVVVTSAITPPVPPGGGGAGGGASTKLPVIGLNEINGSAFFDELQREIIFAKINSYCADKLGEPLALDYYQDQCSLNTEDLKNVNINISSFSLVVDFNDLIKFYDNYKTKKIFQGFATLEDITKYGLFSSVLGIITPLQLNPPSVDIPVFIRADNNFTIKYKILANKVLSSCEVLTGKGNLQCEISNSTIYLTYPIDNVNFISKIFSGSVRVQTDAPTDKIELKSASVVFRVYNFGYKILGIQIWIWGIGLITIILVAGVWFIRSRSKRKIKLTEVFKVN